MRETKFLLVVFGYLVLDIFTFSLILPWLPTVLESFENGQDSFYFILKTIIRRVGTVFSVQNTANWDNVVLGGLITSAFSFAQFLSSAFVGALSDLYSRKPLLISLQSLSIVIHLLTGKWATSFTWFLCCRLFCGFTRANVAVLTALVSDNSSAGSRARAMAVIGAAYSIGFTMGPLLSAVSVSRLIDRSEPGQLLEKLSYGAALLNTVGLLLLCFRWPHGSVQIDPNQSVKVLHSRASGLLNVRKLFSFNGSTGSPAGDARLWQLSIFWFLYLFMFSGLEFTLLFLTRSRFGYTSQDQGRMFFFLGIVMALVQGGLIRRIRFSEVNLGSSSIFCLGVASMILAVTWNSWIFYAGLTFFAFASAAFVPSFQAMVSLLAEPGSQGRVLGIFRSLNALARAIGPGVLSLLFWFIGPMLCYVFCAGLLIILGAMYMHSQKFSKGLKAV